MSSPLIDASSWLPEWGLTAAVSIAAVAESPESSSSTTSTSSLFYTLLWIYFMIEICFAILFHFYLVPRANQRVSPQPYRDFGNDRDVVLMRILERMKQTCPDKESFQKAVVSFLHLWCEPLEKEEPLQAAVVKEESSPISHLVDDVNNLMKKGITTSLPLSCPLGLSRESMSTATTFDDCESSSTSSTSSFSSDDDVAMEKLDTGGNRMMSRQQLASLPPTSSPSSDETFIVPDIGKDEMDIFLSWVLFEKEPSQLLDWERAVLAKSYQRVQKEYGIGFAPGNCRRYEPRRLSLEDVNSLWRPLGVYIFFWALTVVGAVVLRAAGFQRIISQQTGLTGWYRPSRGKNAQLLLPLLFFHGIAPGGLFVYIPMILFRFANDDRAVFLFDNTNISCSLGFGALREAETVQGVMELVDRYLPSTKSTGLCLCGQSFGSCTLTWLLHVPDMRRRIKQLVLLDPVTILLSEPDVMANFLYSTSCDKIHMMASSELFTEYYLRRHFAWYNSELWLKDIPDSVQVLIFLSGQDEIINAPKVRRHIELFGGRSSSSSLSLSSSRYKVLFWEEATHARCVASPSKWTEIKQAMLEQELAIAKMSR